MATRTTGRAAAYKILAVTSRALILDQVRAHPDGIDTAALAGLVGLHPNTVRFHLDVLADGGLVTGSTEGTRRPGRPRLVFTATRGTPPPAPEAVAAPPPAPKGGGEPPALDGYALLAAVLIQHLDRHGDGGPAAEAAGRSWTAQRPVAEAGPATAAGPAPAVDTVTAVTDLLADLGFAPEPLRDDGGWRILLHRCPFHTLAETDPQIVCRLHLGLLQGALDRLDLPGDSVRLQPFIAPGLCEVDLPLEVGAPSLRQ